tara:strand:- start:129 stop:521 length:393 start_codon:yes stop_codon:yes gene_type:complete
METKDGLYTMHQIVKDYKNYGGYSDADSKEIWQQLQNLVNNINPNTLQNMAKTTHQYPKITRNKLLDEQIKMLSTVFGSSRYMTQPKYTMLRRVLSDGYYKEEDKELLNEIRSDYVRETANNSEMYSWGN